MNVVGQNKTALNETSKTLELLKPVPGYENITEEELCRISESLKELSLLLRMICTDGISPDHGS